jgi:hypothetical protein
MCLLRTACRRVDPAGFAKTFVPWLQWLNSEPNFLATHVTSIFVARIAFRWYRRTAVSWLGRAQDAAPEIDSRPRRPFHRRGLSADA